MEKKKDQYAQSAEKYAAEKASAYRQHFELPTFSAALGRLDGSDVLDLACGDGTLTRIARGLGARRVVGVDRSPAMTELARSHESRNPLGIEYHTGDASDGSVVPEPRRFDVVTAGFLFNYAESEEELSSMMATAAGALAPGGRLVTLVSAVHLRSEEALATAGIRRITSPPSDEGGTVEFELTSPLGSLRLVNWCWSRGTHERALEKVGLRLVRWSETAEPSAEGQRLIADEPAWSRVVEEPPFRLFEATRSART